MMKATELRIGNWVMYSSKIQVNENKIRECVDHPDRFAPIPLTEEWLERFGFEQGMLHSSAYMSLGDFRVYFDIDNGELDGTFDYGKNHFFTRAKLDYIHQLQNLYFALTGEELNQNKEDEAIN